MDLGGADRFEIQHRVGSGGMGVVYRAIDRRRRACVALKTLRLMGSSNLLRFKNEFRALADVAHPNLVTLYELLALEEQWFFTMEFVEGVHFSDFVRPLRAASGAKTTGPATTPYASAASAITVDLLREEPTEPASEPRAPATDPGVVDEERLRHGLPQLFEGVLALHHAGKLHRDLKPSNVIVNPQGTVMVCDFGLVADVKGAPSDGAGTPVYMSPEQLGGEALTPASDWYSVGIMLYEALAGRVPFRGDRSDMVQRKRHVPAPPSTLRPGVPRDLEEVCLGLLEPRADQRWTGERALEALAGTRARPRRSTPDTPFVGRRAELERLARCLRTASTERAQTVLVHAPSGLGKSALVKRFLESGVDAGALVLSGRCFDRESVPYRALDGVVDALAWHLRSLPPDRAAALLPADLAPLCRLFPVLRQVEAGADGADLLDEAEPLEVRRRGWDAFRELLARLAAIAPLVIAIDDIQWSDVDSAHLLQHLLDSSGAPRVLWLFCSRREDLASSPVVSTLRSIRLPGSGSPLLEELALEPLTPVEASTLVSSLGAAGGEAEALMREGEGSPFLLQELARFRATTPVEEGASRPGLDEMIRARVGELPPPPLALLELLAIAGRPLRSTTLQHALRGSDVSASLAMLRVQRLLKISTRDDRAEVETYHDRIRESVATGLDPERRKWVHRRLAEALSEEPQADAEHLAEHWLGAGDRERARGHAFTAAQRAYAALAFEQAARLSRMAIELGGGEGAEGVPLWSLLGTSLANASRGLQAADAFLEGARRASDREALDLERRAGEQFLQSGELERGRALMAKVLRALGMRAPPTTRGALMSLLKGRLQLRLRGLAHRRRSEAELAPDTLRRIDICWSIAVSLGFTETFRGADFQTQCLLMALRAGEPNRLSRALAAEASFHGAAGQSSAKRVNELLLEAGRLANELDDPYVQGVLSGTKGFATLMRGEWQLAHDCFAQAGRLMANRSGSAFERVNMLLYRFTMLYYLGRFRELGESVPQALSGAQARGDVYLETFLRCRTAYLVSLARNRPGEARAHAVESGLRWKVSGFHLQHHYQMIAETEIDLYEGRGEAALARARATWPDLRRSLLTQMQLVRVVVGWLQASGALAVAREGGAEAEALRREALGRARRLEREGGGYILAKACLIRAAVANQRGQLREAVDLLSRAMVLLREAGMEGHYRSAEWRFGELVGGAEGAKRVQAARTWFEDERIEAPQRLMRVLCPGW